MADEKRPIWYEPHPVSAERKRELRAKGYRIVDAVYRPPEAKAPAASAQPAEPPDATATVAATSADGGTHDFAGDETGAREDLAGSPAEYGRRRKGGR